MAYVIGNSGSKYSPVSKGHHLAIIYAVADLGWQKTNFGLKRQTFVGFEVVDETADYTDKAGNQRSIRKTVSKRVTASMHADAALRGIIEGILGKTLTRDEVGTFDLFSILGKGCQIDVDHRDRGDKTYVDIAQVEPWPKDARHPAGMDHELIRYTPQEPDDLLKFPEFVQARITEQLSEEEVAAATSKATATSKVQRPTRKIWADEISDEEPPPHDRPPLGPNDLDDDIDF